MTSEINKLDIRPIIPREKHPTIFATFEALNIGEAFQLINDHDRSEEHTSELQSH